jgi:hypothetical protein
MTPDEPFNTTYVTTFPEVQTYLSAANDLYLGVEITNAWVPDAEDADAKVMRWTIKLWADADHEDDDEDE